VTNINSVSIWEDSLILTEIVREDSSVIIKKAVQESLPIFLNHQTIQSETSINQLVDHFKDFQKKYQLDEKKLRITIPGRFTIIKKIKLEKSIADNNYIDQIFYEFEKFWEESSTNYNIYVPDLTATNTLQDEVLAIAIRKNVLDFFKNIFKNANISLELLTTSCFTIDELFKMLFPNSAGQILLLGWHHRGFEAIIIDDQNFINYFYRPYNKNLESIEKVDEFELANGFSNLIYNLQHPSILAQPIYDIQTIYNYGYYFRTEWLDFMRSRVQIPINLFNFDASTTFKLSFDVDHITSEQIFKYIEPISNVF
jgi:hypothetical protein